MRVGHIHIHVCIYTWYVYLYDSERYIYQIYMVHELDNWHGEASITLNHGMAARTYGNQMNEPRFSGVAPGLLSRDFISNRRHRADNACLGAR